MSRAVLITGGAGYLGARLAANEAFRSTWDVRVGVRASTSDESRNSSNVVPLDLSSAEQLKEACFGIDCIVHLAATNELDAARDPSQAITVNTLGTLNLLRAAISTGVDRFLLVSTAHVYGTPLSGVITEQTPTRPVHPYAISKRAAEDFVLSAADSGELTGIIVRLSNGFGTPMTLDTDRWKLVVNDLCRQAVTDRVLMLRTSGLQRRDFIPIADILRAIQHCLELPPKLVADGLFNLGGEAALRIIDIAQLIAERCRLLLGFKPVICRPEATAREHDLPLEFRIDKLKATGFKLMAAPEEEIDAILLMCERSFGKAGI